MTAGMTPKEKVKRAAADPRRPGKACKAEPGEYRPLIDLRRCEGKHDCVDVCPHDVFEVRRIDDADFAALSFLGRLKSRAHKRRAAYATNSSACLACGLCVVACPEGAIELERVVS